MSLLIQTDIALSVLIVIDSLLIEKVPVLVVIPAALPLIVSR